VFRKKWRKKCKPVLINKANPKRDSSTCNKKLTLTRRSYLEASNQLQESLMFQLWRRQTAEKRKLSAAMPLMSSKVLRKFLRIQSQNRRKVMILLHSISQRDKSLL
jgi:hypothetical protein